MLLEIRGIIMTESKLQYVQITTPFVGAPEPYYECRVCEECGDHVDEVIGSLLFDCLYCELLFCIVCLEDHFIQHRLEAFADEGANDVVSAYLRVG
jgi:hypothetical protein